MGVDYPEASILDARVVGVVLERPQRPDMYEISNYP